VIYNTYMLWQLCINVSSLSPGYEDT